MGGRFPILRMSPISAHLEVRRSDGSQAPLRHLPCDVSLKLRQRSVAEVAFLGVANADALGGGFFFADDEHVGDFLELGVADFGADFFGGVVEGSADAGVAKLG